MKTGHDVIGLIFVNNVIQQCHAMSYNVMLYNDNVIQCDAVQCHTLLVRFNWDLNPDLRSVVTPRRAYYTSEP